jgi:hypothetical protein
MSPGFQVWSLPQLSVKDLVHAREQANLERGQAERK